MQRHHIVLTGCCANARLHHAVGESQLVRGSNPARAVCAVRTAVQKHTTASGTIRACHSIAVRLRPANAASLRLRTVHRLVASTMLLASCCSTRTSCARPSAVKERRRKLHRVECATSTMTPRASNAIEHGSLPYAFRQKNFAALSRTLGFCDLGVHKVYLLYKRGVGPAKQVCWPSLGQHLPESGVGPGQHLPESGVGPTRSNSSLTLERDL